MKPAPRRERRPLNRLGRAFTGLVIGLGFGAIALALMPAAPASISTGGLPHESDADLTQSSGAHATRASTLLRSGSGSSRSSEVNPLTVQPTPRPIIRDAPPLGAQSAIGGARGISTGRPTDQSASAPPSPFSVVIAVEDEASLGALGLAIAGGLQQAGVNAALLPLAQAGRPDVILALNGVPGGRNESWFCDPGPEQSVILATRLLDAIGPGDEGAPLGESPQSNFPCQDIHNGRARVPSVLLELAHGGADADPAVIIQALRDYLSAHRSAVLAARAAPRLIWPALGPVTSHYNASHPLGIDIGQWEGAVVAATDGIVSFAGGDACCSYGTYVLVESRDGIVTLYAHLNSLYVTEGEQVRQGQPLGEVGCTGTCFGTHLHFEVWQDDVRQDPMRYLD